VISFFGRVKTHSSITLMIPHLCKNCFKLSEMGMFTLNPWLYGGDVVEVTGGCVDYHSNGHFTDENESM